MTAARAPKEPGKTSARDEDVTSCSEQRQLPFQSRTARPLRRRKTTPGCMEGNQRQEPVLVSETDDVQQAAVLPPA